jgi:hypothetical protein
MKQGIGPSDPIPLELSTGSQAGAEGDVYSRSISSFRTRSVPGSNVAS